MMCDVKIYGIKDINSRYYDSFVIEATTATTVVCTLQLCRPEGASGRALYTMSPSARKRPAESSSKDPSSSNRKGWDTMPDIRTSALSAPAASGPPVHAPSVTVFTNIAGAVSVTVDQAGIDAGHRLRSCLLPENLFNPFRGRRSKIKRGEVGTDADAGIPTSSDAISPRRNAGQPELPSAPSAAAASASANGIKDGVREALDRWALQT